MALSDVTDYIEEDGRAFGMTLAFWAIAMLMIWKFASSFGDIKLTTKILISVLSIPCIFGMVKFQLNR